MTLPEACEDAAARAELPDSIGDADLLGMAPYQPSSTGSYKSTITLKTNGKNSAGKADRRTMSAQLLENRGEKRRVLIVDSMLLFGMSNMPELEDMDSGRISIYTIGDAIYMVYEIERTKTNLCANVTNDSSMSILSEMTPEELAGWLFQSGAYGTYVGRKAVNGVSVYHYRLDAAATRSAHKEDVVTDLDVPRPELVDGNVYIAESGDHLVRLAANYSGEMLSFDFTGRISVQYDLTSVRNGVKIQLPSACQNAGST